MNEMPLWVRALLLEFRRAMLVMCACIEDLTKDTRPPRPRGLG